MTRKIAMFSALLSLCALFATLGCSKNSATDTNFQNALNHYFQGNQECFDIYAQLKPLRGWTSFPFLVTPEYKSPELDALVEVGLLSKKPSNFGTARRYDFTALGSAPCYGNKKVERIFNYTEPGGAPAVGGKKSTVTYIWSLTNVPAWARNLAAHKSWAQTEFANALNSDAPEDKHKGEAEMVLTHLGWRVAAVDGSPVRDDK